MRSLLASAAIAVVATAASSCGGAGTPARTASHTSPAPTAATSTATASAAPAPTGYTRADGDHDNDIAAPHDDTRNTSILAFGHEASGPERQAIIALVKRYYTVALSGDGAKGCAMIYSTYAEALPEDYGSAPGQAPGPPYMRGNTCPAVMTGFFKHFHAQLAVDIPKLRVARVRLEEHHGIALLDFGALPQRSISFAREGHAWRMTALLDRELP